MPWWPWALIAGLFVLGAGAEDEEDEDEDKDDDAKGEDEERAEQWDPTPSPGPTKPYVPVPGMSPLWPLPRSKRKWRASSFAQGRPYGSASPTGHHKAIDIRAAVGDPVLAVDAGTVVGHSGWDGPKTAGLMIQHDGGPVVVYGAVSPSGRASVGNRVQRGQQIAKVGQYPGGSSMLHFEVYRVGTRKRPKWPFGKAQPGSLVDPETYLLATVTT